MAAAAMSERQTFSAVILAAGQGTRMRSDTHKVLHPIAGRAMLLHLLDRVDALGPERTVIVLGKGREQVQSALEGRAVSFAVQEEQKGTGHAVQQASAALNGFEGAVIVLYGDTPFVETSTLRRMLDRLAATDNPGVVVLGAVQDDPAAYGRIIAIGDRILKMVEYKDATQEERAVKLCNSGMLAVRSTDLFKWLGQVGNANAAGEYYLPDIVNVAAKEGRDAVVIEGGPYETAGVNSRAELAHLCQHRPLCQAPPRRGSGRTDEGRQFRRDQEGDSSERREGQSPDLCR
jgi:bifunctional UDP-N-acetylglucosamine pyrophosphorylase/glucosamine-1-phosphate N-acetyltransferase